MGKKTEATRAERKAKKRAAEDAIPDLPGDENVAAEIRSTEKKSKKRKRDGEEAEDAESKKLKKGKKEKKRNQEEANVETEPVEKENISKKHKEKKSLEDEAPAVGADVMMGEVDTEETPKKTKKERKAERRAAELAAKGETESKSQEVGEANDDSKSESEKKKSKKNNRNREKKRKGEIAASTNDDSEKPKEGKSARFIIFVGNLPFTATKESVTAHFAKVHPSSVRLLTQKDNPTKCKGCAFVEFEGYDHMKTCLKLMHHSMFDDGLSPGRKINVELTAGGGGNTKERKDKIKEKNAKLNEERIRKIHEEEKAKAVKAMEGSKPGGAAIDESAIHPSRRRMVPGAV